MVTGIDSSTKMLELARQRLGASAALHLADLGNPLPFPDVLPDTATLRSVLASIGSKLCVFPGERGSMREPATTAAAFGACPEDSRGLKCKGSPRQAEGEGSSHRLMR